MPDTLTQIWKNQRSVLDGKSFSQIIHFVGDGKLRDGNSTSTELREWLSTIDDLEKIRSCAEECLNSPFEDSGLALQDVVNEIGRRLGFTVTPGRYRGVKNAVGNDGLWVGEDSFGLLVEVKSTDTYRIDLDTLVAYQQQLISEGKLVSGNSSILVVVGRYDTGGLEAQIRGSKHAWDIRLISVDALLGLAEVKVKLSDWNTSNKISQVLRPHEYTRLDRIVDLLFNTTKDLAATEAVDPREITANAMVASTAAPVELEVAREAAVKRIEAKLGMTFIRHGRALRASSEGTTRLVCIASGRYPGADGSAGYWYSFWPAQRKFICGANSGYVSLVCGDSGKIYLVPSEEFIAWLPSLATTPPTPSSPAEVDHWHISLNDYGNRVELNRSGNVIANLQRFVV